MAETNTTPNAPRKGRRWLKILGILLGVLVLLVVALFFVVTSAGFFKGFILPRAGKAMNATITVSDASIHPFSEVMLKDLKVLTTGTEPLLTANEVHLRYSLIDIIGGKINVAEVSVAAPTVTMIKNADGTSNLDPITKGQKNAAQETKTTTPSKPSKAAQVDLKKLALTGGTVRMININTNGTRDLKEISNLNVTLENVKNGQTGKLELGADVKLDSHPSAAQAGSAEAKLGGKLDFSLSPDLKPGTVKGNVHFQVNKAQGSFADLDSFATDLDCEVAPTEIKQLAVRFAKGTTQFGQVLLAGPFDMEKSEGKLVLQVLSIDKRLLNLAGVEQGLDFGPTTISSSNVIQLAKGGKAITATGHLDVNKFQVTRAGQTTPQMDLRLQYASDVDTAANNALLRELRLDGTQKGNPLLRADLTSPMTFNWGTANAAGNMPDSTLTFAFNNLNFADWKPFLGDALSSGILNANMKLASQQGGKQFISDLSSTIENLTAGSGSNQLTQASVTMKAHAEATDMKQFKLTECTVQVSRQNQPLLTTSNTGSYNKDTGAATMEFTGKAMLAALLQAFPRPDLSVSSGTLDLKAKLDQKLEARAISANAVVADLTGKSGSRAFNALGAKLDADVAISAKQVADLKQCVLTLSPTSLAAKNQVQLSGQIDSSKPGVTQGNLKLASDALDLTSFYDIFAGDSKTSASASASAATQPVATSASGTGNAAPQPAMTNLPFRNFTAEANLRHVYLREVAISDFVANVKLDGGKLVLNPFKCSLNGAPAASTIDLDLAVPGYKYDFTLNAQKVPLAPLVNSFQPERKGKISGTVIAEANISGVGTEGESLQKTLKGNFNINSTNLNLSIQNVENKMLKTICEVVVSIPSLAANPTGALGSLLGQKSSGSSDELSKSIINAIIARGTAGSGRIELQQTTIQSPLFKADATGTITLAPILTNSTINIPVSISLEKSTASRLSLVPSDTPTNATYAKLPDFFSEKGTVGQPKKDVDAKPLLKLVVEKVGGSVGGNAGSTLQGLGNLLGNKSNTNASGTNASGNKASLLQGAESLFNRNSSATNSSSTNKSSGGLLDQFLKPRNN